MAIEPQVAKRINPTKTRHRHQRQNRINGGRKRTSRSKAERQGVDTSTAIYQHMRIVLFGPPGAGKGTQTARLVEKFGLTPIATGSMIRKAMSDESPLGLEAREYVNEGKLVPGRLVRRIVEECIENAGFDDYILDGYPRTIEQAQWLTDFLSENNAELHAVISIKVDGDAIVERLSRRRVNTETGENYHLDFNPPPEDVDPKLIIQRRDDQPASIRKRLEVYEEETFPVEEFYRSNGVLVEVDGEGAIDEVFARIETVVNQVAA